MSTCCNAAYPFHVEWRECGERSNLVLNLVRSDEKDPVKVCGPEGEPNAVLLIKMDGEVACKLT